MRWAGGIVMAWSARFALAARSTGFAPAALAALCALCALSVVPALSGCYSPTIAAGAPCNPALDNCPTGQRCETTSSGSYCVVPHTLDGSMSSIDANPGCYGTGLITNVCVMPPPTLDVAITANRTINTATVGSGNCDSIIAQPGGGPSLCLVTARTISIAAGATLIGVGPNPLLVVAADSIMIDGTLAVASRTSSALIGAGAMPDCGTGGEGGNGSQDGAGAGGAGGSFGSMGGDGGVGRNGTAGPGSGGVAGIAQAAIVPTTLRGGCPGFPGGDGGGGGGAGAGGDGGGAVYLIAGTTLTVSGTINASGAGGFGGTGGQNAGAGAGGGGSGGMIGLDAPTMMVTGALFANGAGGGGGNGNSPSAKGQNGSEPTVADAAALGGAGGSGGGGIGGKGYALALPPTAGQNGQQTYCGGGGGGGGAGIIRVFGVAPSSLGGAISPPPM